MISLDHPNIIKHILWFKEEYFEINWNINVIRYCLLMEYANGGDLHQKMKRKKCTKEVSKIQLFSNAF